MEKPDWSEAPAEAKWLAQDSTGVWHWYKNQPNMLSHVWAGYGGWQIAGRDKPNENWRNTLEHRPK